MHNVRAVLITLGESFTHFSHKRMNLLERVTKLSESVSVTAIYCVIPFI